MWDLEWLERCILGQVCFALELLLGWQISTGNDSHQYVFGLILRLTSVTVDISITLKWHLWGLSHLFKKCDAFHCGEKGMLSPPTFLGLYIFSANLTVFPLLIPLLSRFFFIMCLFTPVMGTPPIMNVLFMPSLGLLMELHKINPTSEKCSSLAD